jgi:hypothetical protein
MNIMDAWELVKAGAIRGEWRRWVSVADKREFEWGNVGQRREALLACAEHVEALNERTVSEQRSKHPKRRHRRQRNDVDGC